MAEKSKILIIVLAGLSLIGLLALALIFSRPQAIESRGEEKFHAASPAGREFFETAYQFVGPKIFWSGKRVVAGIIPHHLLAADLIADFFHNLSGEEYQTIILLGPNHFLSGQADLITSAYDWQTPYGILCCDRRILRELTAADLGLAADETAMAGEHAINSEVAFIKKTFPQAEIVPLILKPTVDAALADKLARALFKISQEKKILVLASVDFSHYQTSVKAQQDDQASIAVMTDFVFDQIYQMAVDSPPTIYTVLKFSRLSQADFHLQKNSNSALLSNQPDLPSTTSYVTGYFVR